MDNIDLIIHRTLGWVSPLPRIPLFWAQADETGTVRTGRRPLLEFFLVTAGTFPFTVGGTDRTLRAGDLALFNAHFDNYGDLRDGPDRYACASFTVEDRGPLSDLARAPLFEVTRMGDVQRVLGCYQRLAALHHGPESTVRAFRIKAAVLDLLSALTEESRRAGPSGSGVPRAIAFLNEHHGDPGIDLGRIAAAAHVTGAHLCRSMKAQTGLPPMRYLEQIRMRRAADLLLHTGHEIKRVSYTVGFSDQLHFSRVFRRHYGKSPTAYRAAQPGTL